MRHGIEYYGADHVFYGSDYPCWNPDATLKHFNEIELSVGDQRKILHDNVQRVLKLGKAKDKTSRAVGSRPLLRKR